MPRRYVHSTTIPGSSIDLDTKELSELLDRASSVNMTVQSMRDELAESSGFDKAARNWIMGRDIPNGLVRKIILSNARALLKEK